MQKFVEADSSLVFVCRIVWYCVRLVSLFHEALMGIIFFTWTAQGKDSPQRQMISFISSLLFVPDLARKGSGLVE